MAPEPDTPADRVHALRVDLGRQPVAHREAADLTQDGLGRRAAYSRTTIASIETAASDAERYARVALAGLATVPPTQ